VNLLDRHTNERRDEPDQENAEIHDRVDQAVPHGAGFLVGVPLYPRIADRLHHAFAQRDK
jgi:hypothetical protein